MSADASQLLEQKNEPREDVQYNTHGCIKDRHCFSIYPQYVCMYIRIAGVIRSDI